MPKTWKRTTAVLAVFFAGSLLLPPLLQKKTAGPVPSFPPVRHRGERVRLIEKNEDALLWRLRLIQQAKQRVVLSAFDLREDTTGRAVMAALMDAADRGVQVQLLIDGADAQLCLQKSQAFRALLSHPHIQARYYNPLRPSALWKANYRLHDKYLVMDSRAYILGGRNVQDQYLTSHGANVYTDRDVLVYIPPEKGAGQNLPPKEAAKKKEASSLRQLAAYFESIWTGKDCFPLRPRLSQKQYQLCHNALACQWGVLSSQYGKRLSDFGWERETEEAAEIQLLTGGTAAASKPPLLWQQLCRRMESAAQEVLIQTPFVICDSHVMGQLEQVRRHVPSLRILTNTAENSVNPLGAEYFNQRKKLLDAGIELYEYGGKQPMHAKTILIGQNISIIGSFNLDNRSAYLDTEIMLAIDCPQLNRELRGHMEKLFPECRFTAPGNEEQWGASYSPALLPPAKRAFYVILRTLLHPFRYLI